MCWSQICMKRAKIQCMFKAPFLGTTFNSPWAVDLWRRRRKMHVVQVFHNRTEPYIFAGLNHADIHCIQRPPFVQTIHYLYLNSADHKGKDTDNNKMEQRSQELDWDKHMLCMHFHSLPSARVVSVGPVCDPQNQVGVIGLTRMIQKDKTRRVHTADTVCVQEYHVYSNVDGLRVLPADWLSPRRHHLVYPWSVRWQPIRFERMSTVLITDCVHTPGDCTRTSPRWCKSIHPRVA